MGALLISFADSEPYFRSIEFWLDKAVGFYTYRVILCFNVEESRSLYINIQIFGVGFFF